MRVKVCLECRVLATTGSVAAEGAYRAVRALGRRQPPEAGWDIIGPWGGLRIGSP